MAEDSEAFVIRPAKPGDFGAVLRYIKDLAVHQGYPESIVTNTEEDLCADLIDSPYVSCLVAEEKNLDTAVVSAFLIYAKSYSTWKGKALYVEDVYVRKESRGKGIGKAFIKFLSKMALEENYCKLHWIVLDNNEVAVKFYETIDTEIDKRWYYCTFSRAKMAKLLD